MKKLMAIIGLLLVIMLVTVSCARTLGGGKSEQVVTPPAPQIQRSAMESKAASPAPSVSVAAPSESSGATLDQQLATDRMIVRTGNMSLVVEDVPVAIDQITSMAEGFEGYVVSSSVWEEEEKLAGSITIRVPAEHFDAAVGALRGLAVDVTSETTSSKDVTEEYVDLEAKLGNLEATEKQLLVIMEKAETVDDILAVQRELSNVRGEIDQTKAQMQYLERTSESSLIEISLEQSKVDIQLYANKATVKERENIQFYVQVSGGFPPYSYEWDFGDGTTSTGETPTHAYKADGSYTVSLKVTDDKGNTNSQTRIDYITVLPGWGAGSIVSGAWNGLITFGRVLADIFIWIGIFSPIWIVVGGIVYGIIYWRRRRSRQAR
jgi:hypothetical protein